MEESGEATKKGPAPFGVEPFPLDFATCSRLLHNVSAMPSPCSSRLTPSSLSVNPAGESEDQESAEEWSGQIPGLLFSPISERPLCGPMICHPQQEDSREGPVR